MGEVQGSSVPGLIILGGYCAGAIIWGNFPRWELYGGNCPGVIFWGAAVRRAIVLCGNCPGGNCPRWQLSGGNCLGCNCPWGNCPVPETRSFFHQNIKLLGWL